MGNVVFDFNPRSREGSDAMSTNAATCATIFQSTLPRRERPIKQPDNDPQDNISIHAPAKGATEPTQTTQQPSNDFNPRSREGSDHTRKKIVKRIINFNPRSREGSDPGLCARSGCSVHFNPRSREGSDDRKQPHCTAGADFNPRSREGSDKIRRRRRFTHNHFNPRSREGSD